MKKNEIVSLANYAHGAKRVVLKVFDLYGGGFLWNTIVSHSGIFGYVLCAGLPPLTTYPADRGLERILYVVVSPAVYTHTHTRLYTLSP